MDERVIEPLIILARQRAVQVVALPVIDAAGSGRPSSPGWAASMLGPSCADISVPSRLAEHLAAVDRLRKDDWTDRIVKVQMVAANESRDGGRQSRGGERAGGDDDGRRLARNRNRPDLLASDRD